MRYPLAALLLLSCASPLAAQVEPGATEVRPVGLTQTRQCIDVSVASAA